METKPKFKYYMVHYEGKLLADRSARMQDITFGVKASSSIVAILSTPLHKMRHAKYKKPKTKMISEEEFLKFPNIATNNPNIRWK